VVTLINTPLMMQNVPVKCMAVKNFNFKNFKMADSRHLENRTIAISHDVKVLHRLILKTAVYP